MALNSILVPSSGFSLYCSTLNADNGINLEGSGIINVSEINGLPIGATGGVLDPNPVNVIYKPGVSHQSGSNIYGSWGPIVLKANQINVNQCLNIYIDTSIQSPAVIDQSLDCKGRINFIAAAFAFPNVSQSQMYINDGVQLKNVASFQGDIQVICNSVSQSCLTWDNYYQCQFLSDVIITNTSGSILPAIQYQNGYFNSIEMSVACRLDNSNNPSIPVIGIGATGALSLLTSDMTGLQISNTIYGVTGSNLVFINDGSQQTPDQSLFSGRYQTFYLNNAYGVNYNDSLVSPQIGASSVQGAIDILKQGTEILSNLVPLSLVATDVSGLLTSNTSQLVPSLKNALLSDLSSSSLVCTDSSGYLSSNSSSLVPSFTNIQISDLSDASGYFYQAGSYIPTLGDGTNNFTTTFAAGRYVAVGKSVSVNAWVLWSSKGAASGTILLSLPSSVSANMPRPAFAIGNGYGITFSPGQLTCAGVAGANNVGFFINDPSGGASVTLTDSAFGSGGELQVSGCYEMA